MLRHKSFPHYFKFTKSFIEWNAFLHIPDIMGFEGSTLHKKKE
jgi:hypothetical protein